MPCRLCRERGSLGRYSDPPVCAFDDSGAFLTDNWNCATMNALREIADRVTVGVEEVHGGCVAFDDANDGGLGKVIALCWYKFRGRTATAVVLDDEGGSREMTLADAEAATETHARLDALFDEMGGKS